MKPVELTGEKVRFIDQRRLPGALHYLEVTDYREVAEAIRNMTVRGAPAIGIAAAYGFYLGARQMAATLEAAVDPQALLAPLKEVATLLRGTRPTAVNLFWALGRMWRRTEELVQEARATGNGVPWVVEGLRREALAIHAEDIEMNHRIGRFGQELIPDGAGVLTHCNTGALATGDYGTALGVIRAAKEQGKRLHVYVDETRPLLQGARLTAWELVQEQIPATLITDNMAGYLMKLGKVQVVIVGADRITANGDVANKIGTYAVAVLARVHNIPFYVAAPSSTIDFSLSSGDDIIIEERKPEEVTTLGGVRIAPEGVSVFNPAFDVTPSRYVTGIITDQGVIYPPFSLNLRRLAGATAPTTGKEWNYARH